MPLKTIKPLYDSLIGKGAKAGPRDLKGNAISTKLQNLVMQCRVYLDCLPQTALVSGIESKQYFVFRDLQNGKSSRAVNSDLYLHCIDTISISDILNCAVGERTPLEITRIIYTMAMAYCCSMDILKDGDQKTTGTFFEVLIGHLVARSFDVNPEQQIKVPTLDLDITLPTDFVFDLGLGKNRVHLPIKTSTRERVVQVWAHQRVLDGMHGVARFKGILVAMAETNKQEKKNAVVEVCLPNQWMAYQMYIAQMFRVYYLDLPKPYLLLKDRYPFIQVKMFGEFFFEIEKIMRSGVES